MMSLLETVDKCLQFVDKYSFDEQESKEDISANDKDIITFVIDGNNFDDMESFYNECERAFNVRHGSWGRNLDALIDILRGGWGNIPEDDNFIVIWKNSDISKKRLGHRYRVKQLKRRLKYCHSDWYEKINKDIIAAQNGMGPTTFDDLVRIIGSCLRLH